MTSFTLKHSVVLVCLFIGVVSAVQDDPKVPSPQAYSAKFDGGQGQGWMDLWVDLKAQKSRSQFGQVPDSAFNASVIMDYGKGEMYVIGYLGPLPVVCMKDALPGGALEMDGGPFGIDNPKYTGQVPCPTDGDGVNSQREYTRMSAAAMCNHWNGTRTLGTIPATISRKSEASPTPVPRPPMPAQVWATLSGEVVKTWVGSKNSAPEYAYYKDVKVGWQDPLIFDPILPCIKPPNDTSVVPVTEQIRAVIDKVHRSQRDLSSDTRAERSRAIPVEK